MGNHEWRKNGRRTANLQVAFLNIRVYVLQMCPVPLMSAIAIHSEGITWEQRGDEVLTAGPLSVDMSILACQE